MTPLQAKYELLLKLKAEHKKVHTRHPPLHENEGWWDEKNAYFPNSYFLVKVGKRKSHILLSAWPSIEIITMVNDNIATEEEWNEAQYRWSKEKLWKVLTK